MQKITNKKVPNGLYKKLAAYSVVIAFSFGLIISTFQIYTDYAQQDSRLVDEIRQRVSLVQASAEKAIYEFDEKLAQLVINSISEHPAVLSLAIYDDYNDLFINKEVKTVAERPKWWPSALAFQPRSLTFGLNVNSELKEQDAHIEVNVDPYLVVNDFFDRSILIIVTGIIRNFLLAFALLFLSYRFVTRPINGLKDDLSVIDPLDTEGQSIVIPEKHKNNELGSLARLFNDLLDKIRQSIRQIKNLNHELNQEIKDKEQIEKALNLAEERTAGRTGQEFINAMVEFIAHTLQMDGAAIYRRVDQGVEVNFEPNACQLYDTQKRQRHLKLDELPLELLSEQTPMVVMDVPVDEDGDVFRTMHTVLLPIRDRKRSIVNILQLASHRAFPNDFYERHKSLLQIFCSRFATESERERQERMILDVAHKDNLTRLSNRNHFQQVLMRTLKSADQNGDAVILLHIDINNFKWINDSFGHTVGDQLLIQLAERLQGLVSDSCHLARIGGDEFVITMLAKEPGPEALLSQNVHTSIKKSFVVDNHLINPKVSIGIAMYPQNAKDSGQLIKHADIAVHMAKRNEGVKTQYFTQEVAEHIERKILIAKLLESAIDYSLLSLRFQPIFNSGGTEIHSVEVLCRWNNPELGIISPEEFIPVAEETGLIHQLGLWVLKEAIQQMKVIIEDGSNQTGVKFAINFSAHQLQNQVLVEQYLAEIRNHAIDPSLIVFEITESMLIDDLDQGSETLQRIAQLGCGISIDDFGTGYSSLQYLKHLPIQKLKIDKGFIKGVPGRNSDMNIVTAIISLAKAMNMQVIAEGIENEDQVEFLKGLGCDLMQGFYYAKPLKSEELLTLMQNQSRQSVAGGSA